MPPTERSTTREVTARRRRLITQRFTAGESTSTCGDDDGGGRQRGTSQVERRHTGARGRGGGAAHRPEDSPGGRGSGKPDGSGCGARCRGRRGKPNGVQTRRAPQRRSENALSPVHHPSPSSSECSPSCEERKPNPIFARHFPLRDTPPLVRRGGLHSPDDGDCDPSLVTGARACSGTPAREAPLLSRRREIGLPASRARGIP